MNPSRLNLPKWPALAVLAALAGCASGPPETGPISPLLGRAPAPGAEVRFPDPPDTARIQFLLGIASQGDIEGRGGGGTAVRKPYGVELARGRLWVCDTELNGVVIFDLGAQTFRRFLPQGEARLRTPTNCAVDPATGDLYVVDNARRDVVVFDSTLSYAGNLLVEGGTASDVFVDGDTVWVSDVQRQVVDVYHKGTRRLVRTVDPSDAGPQAVLNQPFNIWVRDDLLYVSDFGAFSVRIFDRAGNHVRTTGRFGRGIGQFTRPKGIAVDPEGRYYVVDAGFANVQVFGPGGELLMVFGGPYRGPGGMWLPAGITINTDPVEIERFRDYVMPGYDLDYLILVANQFGPDKVGVYGFLRPLPQGVGGS